MSIGINFTALKPDAGFSRLMGANALISGARGGNISHDKETQMLLQMKNDELAYNCYELMEESAHKQKLKSDQRSYSTFA